jgi:hypothetical protein
MEELFSGQRQLAHRLESIKAVYLSKLGLISTIRLNTIYTPQAGDLADRGLDKAIPQ